MSRQRRNEARAAAAALVILIFVHPSLLDVAFGMFDCEEIDGTLRLRNDPGEKCYEGLHLFLALFVALPACLLWGFGIPAYSFAKVYLNRKRLGAPEVKEELGYLYNGYLSHAYYWESVILFRKVGMVALATVCALAGRKVQAMLVFAFIIGAGALQCIVRPFMTDALNGLELTSILGLTISIYSGIFFVTDSSNNPTTMETRNDFKLSDSEKFVLFMLFILSNALFFVCWLMLFATEAKNVARRK
jgi:hypothetical protein